MNLTQLRAFHAVAQDGSFTKAAERLCVTQPAVTASIAALEERHGVALFNRHGRSITLTEAGKKLVAVSRQLFALEEEASEILTAEQQLQSGILRLCVGNPYTIAPYLRSFQQAYPGVDLRVIPGNYETVRDFLLTEQADLAVQTEADDIPQVRRQVLARQRLVVFCRIDAPLPRSSVSLSELQKHNYIARESGSATRRFFKDLCAKHNADIKGNITAENRETAFELVANGLGYGIVLDAELPRDERIRTVQIEEAAMPFTDYLLYLKRRENLRLVRAFLDLIPQPSDHADGS